MSYKIIIAYIIDRIKFKSYVIFDTLYFCNKKFEEAYTFASSEINAID